MNPLKYAAGCSLSLKLRRPAFLVGVIILLASQAYLFTRLYRLGHPFSSGPLRLNVAAFLLSALWGMGYLRSGEHASPEIAYGVVGSIVLGGCVAMRWMLPSNLLIQLLIVGLSDIVVATYCWHLLNTRATHSLRG
jgi:hypothetical protein